MNLAMKRKIWTLQQDLPDGSAARKKWFVFIDTDTFVEWENIFELLEHFDTTERFYFGSPVWLPGLQFAHGGSAYVLSYGALEALNTPGPYEPETSMHSQYGLNTTALCCGDEALARALKIKGVTLKGYWPMFNGEIPATVSFGRHTWCEPVISLHHLSGEDMQRLWLWIEDWKAKTMSKVSLTTLHNPTSSLYESRALQKHTLTKIQHPLLFKDLFDYIAPHLTAALEHWDNTHESMKIFPTKKASHTSFGHCSIACEADRLCFQFVYDGKKCALSHHIRLGGRRSPEETGTQRYVSGWNLDRIQDWTTSNDCASAYWVRSNP